MHFWGGDYHMWAFPFGMLMMFVFWALVIWGLISLFRNLSGGSSQHQGEQESAEDIVKKRYARGEINKEEFERILADLRS